uniref:Uncharacterized protein n=1 Tax=Russula virescens TaxID=71688 RepID=A0A2S0U411_9AGAM|nr:hypothetical protein [Russula virescens]AWB36225.1 hypothetical protein [Russula virescens]
MFTGWPLSINFSVILIWLSYPAITLPNLSIISFAVLISKAWLEFKISWINFILSWSSGFNINAQFVFKKLLINGNEELAFIVSLEPTEPGESLPEGLAQASSVWLVKFSNEGLVKIFLPLSSWMLINSIPDFWSVVFNSSLIIKPVLSFSISLTVKFDLGFFHQMDC